MTCDSASDTEGGRRPSGGPGPQAQGSLYTGPQHQAVRAAGGPQFFGACNCPTVPRNIFSVASTTTPIGAE